MKYKLEGEFYTDGDYRLDFNYWEFQINNYEKHIKCDDELYSFCFETEDVYYARDFLATLITIYRVGSSHYSLIKPLYDMTEKIIDALFDDNTKEITESISGNYDGTHILLIKEQF